MTPGFFGSEKEQSGRAIQAGLAMAAEPMAGQFVRQGGFTRHFHTLAGDIEEGHRLEGHAAGTETLRIRFPAHSQRRDNAHASDDNTTR